GRRRDELELLGGLPADLDQGRPVVRADLLRLGQVVHDLDALHPPRQRSSTALRPGMGGNVDEVLVDDLRPLGAEELLGLVEQAELIAMDPLAARTEALALEQADVLAQLLDLAIPLPDQRLQRLDVVRKRGSSDHVPEPNIRDRDPRYRTAENFRSECGLSRNTSIPSSSQFSSRPDTASTVSSPGPGQGNRSRSSRFCQRTKPLRSQTRSFTWSRLRLQKAKTSAEKGSSSSSSATRADRPLIALRKSTGSRQRWTRTCSTGRIRRALRAARGASRPPAPRSTRALFRSGAGSGSHPASRRPPALGARPTRRTLVDSPSGCSSPPPAGASPPCGAFASPRRATTPSGRDASRTRSTPRPDPRRAAHASASSAVDRSSVPSSMPSVSPPSPSSRSGQTANPRSALGETWGSASAYRRPMRSDHAARAEA